MLNEVDESKKKTADAKEYDLEKLRRHEVYEVVPFTGQDTVSSRWVFTDKI